MSPNQEAMAQALETFLNAAETFEPKAYGDFFSQDAQKIDPNGSEPVRGREEIVSRFRTKRIDKIKSWQIHRDNVYFAGDGCALLWRVNLETKEGEKSQFEGIDVFDFDHLGKCVKMTTFPRKTH